MERQSERLIDVFVLTELLFFAWAMRGTSPEITGVIVAAAVGFWFSKNATAPDVPKEEAAATAAASVLAVANREAQRHAQQVIDSGPSGAVDDPVHTTVPGPEGSLADPLHVAGAPDAGPPVIVQPTTPKEGR